MTRKLNNGEKQLLRRIATQTNSKHTVGGAPKVHSLPKKVSLPKLKCLEKSKDDRI